MFEGSQDLLLTIKHRAYIIGLCLGLCSYGAEVTMSWHLSGFTSYETLMRLVLFLFALYSLVFLLLKNKLDRIHELGFYTLVTLDIVGTYAYQLMFGNAEVAIYSATWLAFVYIFAFFVFEPRRALTVGIGIATPLMLIGFGSYFMRGLPIESLHGLLRANFASSQVLLFAYAASRWRESYVKKKVEAAMSAQLALTDALTGIMNRRAVEGLLEREMAKASRYERPLSLILLDLDHFKKINDTYGHARGDVVLKTLAKLIETNLRLEDSLGRWGGEEFIVVCSETGLEPALGVAERLRLIVADHDWDMPVTASFGVAQWQASETLSEFFERTDKALYSAKQSGRNCVKSWENLPAQPVTALATA